MMTTRTAPDGPAARLRADSLDIHRQTENAPFIVDLLAGRLSVTDYIALAMQLRPVYDALEMEVAAARTTAPPDVVAILDPRLDRTTALDNDLVALGGDTFATPRDETAAYVARINATADEWPRLLAHHYVRYLGDLSGGQIIAARLRHWYGIGDRALTFYAFDGIDSKGGYKDRYRAKLDGLLADPAVYAATLDETLTAYAANRALFDALGHAAA